MKSWSIGKSQSRVYWRAIEKKCINSPQVMTFNSLKINRISWLLLFSLTDWYVHCVVATSVSLCYQHAIRFNRKLCRRWRRDMKLNYSSHKQGRLHPPPPPLCPNKHVRIFNCFRTFSKRYQPIRWFLGRSFWVTDIVCSSTLDQHRRRRCDADPETISLNK